MFKSLLFATLTAASFFSSPAHSYPVSGTTNWGYCIYHKANNPNPIALNCKFKFLGSSKNFQIIWADGASDIFSYVSYGKVIDTLGTIWTVGMNNEFGSYMILTSTKNGTQIAAELTL